jgi:hypothetical protein
MIQRRQDWSLARVSSHAAGILRERFGRNLDGNIAIQPGIGGAPDLAHGALAELGGDRELGNHLWTLRKRRRGEFNYASAPLFISRRFLAKLHALRP